MKIRMLLKCIGFLLALILATNFMVQENQGTAETVVENTVTDVDGNVYQTVTIGNQVWMAENLRTTRYRNGDPIGTTSPANLDISSESAPKYQWAYDGDESNVDIYGRLYTWYAVTDGRNIAPTGWHVPTDAEWTTLIHFLGGDSLAGGKLKETGTTHWASPNAGATNESGFTARAHVIRIDTGIFEGGWHHGGLWWSTSESDTHTAWCRILLYKDSSIIRSNEDKSWGSTVRCLKD